MNIEIEPAIEYADKSVVISSTIGADYDGETSIGYKKFISPGKFEYEWFLHFLTRDDVLELAQSLLFVADHMLCPACEEDKETESE